MGFFVKQKLLDYKKYKLDIWGIVRNSFFIKEKWKRYTYKKLIKKYKRYKKAKRINLKKKQTYKQNKRVLFIIKNINNLIKKVFKLKPSKKLNKICLYFYNKKRRKINLDWWKKKFFIYEVRDTYIKRKKYKYKKEFSDLRLAKNFYIMYTYKQLKKIGRKAKKKDGIFEQNYISLVEFKLPSFLYRTSLLSNMFECINYIKGSNVAVNKIFRPFIFFSIKIMDIVCFRIWEKSYIYWNFYKRLRRKAFLFFFPKYMYISIIFFFTICLNIPKKKDLINPIAMDIYKASSFVI